MGLKLYKKDTSAPCRSVFMVIEALHLRGVELVDMDLLGKKDHLKDDFLKINPQHTIPTLKDEDFVIWDSHAIITYLVNKYAKDDSLYPKEPKKRAVVDQRLHFSNAILFSTLRETMIPLLYLGEKSFKQQNLDKIKSGYEFLENFFNGQWLAGDSLTLADISTVAMISTFNVILPIDKASYPNLTAWFERCSKQDFYIKANVPGLQYFQDYVKSVIN
ncbi:hypothetical protein B5X24_HaOG200233 [Helicoverpa armigera]|nr:hypothetical protein B5X24_HaOG200233 [Helicoverpa armigera]